MYPLNLSVLLGVSLVFLGSALALLKIYGGLARVSVATSASGHKWMVVNPKGIYLYMCRNGGN